MDLINPFDPVGKADTWPPQGATIIRALVRTGGSNLGHGQDLHHTKRNGHNGRPKALEHYKGRKVKALVGKSAARGLKQTGGFAPSGVPRGNRQSDKVGEVWRARNGHVTHKGKLALSGSMKFGDAGSSGRRVG